MTLQTCQITKAQYGQWREDIRKAVVSFKLVKELNVVPEDSTITLSKAVLDPILTAQGINLFTGPAWIQLQTNSYIYFEGQIVATTTVGKNYVCTLKDCVTPLAKAIDSTKYLTQTSVQTIVTNLMTAQLGGITYSADTDKTTCFDCNGQSVIGLLRELIIQNYGAGGTLRAFYNEGNGSSGITQDNWGIKNYFYSSANKRIGFQEAGNKLISPAEKQDTRAMVINDVIVKYNGGQSQVQNAASIASYGRTTRTFVKQEFSNAVDASKFANGIISLFAQPPVYLICKVKIMGEGGQGSLWFNGTYTVADAISAINQAGLVIFKLVVNYPSLIYEVHLSTVPINIIETVSDLGSRMASIEANQPVGTKASPIFAGLTVNDTIMAPIFKFLDTDGISWDPLFKTAVAAPNINAHILPDYTRQAGATITDVCFGYNSDFTSYNWYSKWGGVNIPLMVLSSAGALTTSGNLLINKQDGNVMIVDPRDSPGVNCGINTQWIDATHKIVHFQANYLIAPVAAQLGMDFRMDTRGSGTFQWCYRAPGSGNAVIALMDSAGSLSLGNTGGSSLTCGLIRAGGNVTVGYNTQGEVLTLKANLATGGSCFMGYYPDGADTGNRWAYMGFGGGAGTKDFYWVNAAGPIRIFPKSGSLIALYDTTYLGAGSTWPTTIDADGFFYPRSAKYAEPVADGSRGAGVKVCLYAQATANHTDYAIGVGTAGNVWFTMGDAGAGSFQFLRPTGSGNTMTLLGSLNQAGLFSLPMAGSIYSCRGLPGVSGTYTFGTRTVTITGGIITSVV